MSKVLILKGLPASGKSTYAKKLADEGWVRVNKDDMRAMLHNSNHSKSNEKFVLILRDFIILEALARGKNVVVDDTNLNPIHEEHIRKLVGSTQVEVNDSFLQVPIEECIARDLHRPVSVGEKVIRRMYSEYYKPREEEAAKNAIKYVAPDGAEEAIIVDIDGTLAHNTGGRNIFDYTRVIEDSLDEAVADVVRKQANDGVTVIICSGREDNCYGQTSEWLNKHNIPFKVLYMRKSGDHRKDSIVKKEIFDEKIRDRFHIKFVLDDRNQVVDMWRHEIGLKVLQVAEGNF